MPDGDESSVKLLVGCSAAGPVVDAHQSIRASPGVGLANSTARIPDSPSPNGPSPNGLSLYGLSLNGLNRLKGLNRLNALCG